MSLTGELKRKYSWVNGFFKGRRLAHGNGRRGPQPEVRARCCKGRQVVCVANGDTVRLSEWSFGPSDTEDYDSCWSTTTPDSFERIWSVAFETS